MRYSHSCTYASSMDFLALLFFPSYFSSGLEKGECFSSQRDEIGCHFFLVVVVVVVAAAAAAAAAAAVAVAAFGFPFLTNSAEGCNGKVGGNCR